MSSQVMYTPDQVAQLLQLSESTVYELIKRGEIVAKKLGRVYRVPRTALEFVFSGLDADILAMDAEDKKHLPQIEAALKKVREDMYAGQD